MAQSEDSLIQDIMKSSSLELMSTDQLWELYELVAAELGCKIAAERDMGRTGQTTALAYRPTSSRKAAVRLFDPSRAEVIARRCTKRLDHIGCGNISAPF